MPKPGVFTSPFDRALARIEVTGFCWNWTGHAQRGYGKIRAGGKGGGRSLFVHRVMYEGLVGPIAPEKELDHLCFNTLCVNPDHLDPVTHAVNRSRVRPRMKTHCKNGHEFTPQNTITRADGKQCRECGRIANRASYRKRKTARA